MLTTKQVLNKSSTTIWSHRAVLDGLPPLRSLFSRSQAFSAYPDPMITYFSERRVQELFVLVHTLQIETVVMETVLTWISRELDVSTDPAIHLSVWPQFFPLWLRKDWRLHQHFSRLGPGSVLGGLLMKMWILDHCPDLLNQNHWRWVLMSAF